MVKHIVMWNIIEENKAEHMANIRKRLEGLVGRIPEIHKIEVGINFNASEMAYDLVLYSEFLSKQDLEAYQKHPEHMEISKFVATVRTARVVCDYEVCTD